MAKLFVTVQRELTAAEVAEVTKWFREVKRNEEIIFEVRNCCAVPYLLGGKRNLNRKIAEKLSAIVKEIVK